MRDGKGHSERQLPETAGRPADEIYLIRSGTVALEISLPHEGALCIETVRAGSVVGWSCFVPPYRWRFDARTLSDVGVFAIKTESLRRKCDHDHDFGYSILLRCAPVIAERLQATQIKLLELRAVTTSSSAGGRRPRTRLDEGIGHGEAMPELFPRRHSESPDIYYVCSGWVIGLTRGGGVAPAARRTHASRTGSERPQAGNCSPTAGLHSLDDAGVY